MAEKQVDSKIIKRTQDSLGKVIKKPPLTDKLLQKPPFRFLHDIVTSVIKGTGFMKGLFTDAEMNSENVKDKDSKIAFLQKLIDMVSLVNGKPIAAKPSKIVAGHDPDRTNELLQALAEAVNKKVDNDDYVRRVLKVDDVKPKKDAKKESSKHRDKEESSKRSSEKSENVEGENEKGKNDKDDRHRSKDRSKEKPQDKEEESRKERKQDRDRDRHSENDRERRHRKRGDDDDDRGQGDTRKQQEKDDAEQDEDSNDQRLQRPTSAKGSRRHQSRETVDSKKDRKVSRDDDSQQTSSTQSRPARPSSARPAPPKPKKNDIISEEPVTIGRKAPNVIIDKKGDSDEDEDEDAGDNKANFLDNEDDNGFLNKPPATNSTEAIDDADADHGSLVKKLLDTKKELEVQSASTKKTQIDRSQVVSDAAKRKEHENMQHEVDRLRNSVQTLTRSVNPLGKILDFLQEDLDGMQKELTMWQQENNENNIALQREQSVMETSIEPLKAQLNELDAAINDQLDLIAAVKSTILHNDLRITKMLGTVTKS